MCDLFLIYLGQVLIGSPGIHWGATHHQTEKQISESSHEVSARLLCPHQGPLLRGWDLLKLWAYLHCHAGSSPHILLRAVRMFFLKHSFEIISAPLKRLWCCLWERGQAPQPGLHPDFISWHVLPFHVLQSKLTWDCVLFCLRVCTGNHF